MKKSLFDGETTWKAGLVILSFWIMITFPAILVILNTEDKESPLWQQIILGIIVDIIRIILIAKIVVWLM